MRPLRFKVPETLLFSSEQCVYSVVHQEDPEVYSFVMETLLRDTRNCYTDEINKAC